MACESVRAAVVAWCCATALAGHAAELEVVSAAQSKPGQVKVLVAMPGAEAPRAADFRLRLDAGRAIAATSVTAVPSASASAPARPVALLLCLDRSGSMGGAVVAMQHALRESLVLHNGWSPLPFSVAIVAFGTQTTHLLTLTNNTQQVAASIARLELERERGGKTRLHDAVAGGLAELRNSDVGDKHLLVVSDGNDEGSAISQRQLIELAMRAPSIPVDAIGFGALASSSSGSLSTLAGATGGRFTIANTQDELRAMLGRLVQQAVSAPRFEISFTYPPVPDRLVSQPASLLHVPVSGTPSEWMLDLRLSAVASQLAAAPVPLPAGWRRWFPFLLSPSFVWVGVGLLLALAGIVALHRVHRPEAAGQGRPDVAPLPLTQLAAPSAQVSTPPALPSSPARRMTMIAHHWPASNGDQPVAMLFVTSGAGAGRCFEIRRAQTRIGSADDNEVVLADDDFASSHHAMLRAEANGLYLADLGSSNGSLLRGERFKNGVRALTPGDRFTLGRTEFEVAGAEAPPGGEAVFDAHRRSSA